MMFFARNKVPFRCLLAAFVIVSSDLFFQGHHARAEEMPIPAGFHRTPNGDIMVEDPTIAVAPPGYRISKNGILEKEDAGAAESAGAVAEERIADSGIEEIPPGFHRMPNGDIMANNPSKAVAPPGYQLTEGGVLRKMEGSSLDAMPATSDVASTEAVAAAATVDDFGGEIPPGFHRMPDGTLMANNPSKAAAPEGYHLMPDGTLMAQGGSTEHSRHSHRGGGMWMAEYQFERMYMKGLLDTTTEVSPEEVVDPAGKYGYLMSPTDMTMDMHMLMLMYHTTQYMVMVMGHYMSNDMGMLSNDGTTSTMTNSGLGDTIVTLEAPWRYNLDYTIGLSLPTGSIDEHGPMQHTATVNTDTKYPYSMQLGSGTYDLILGIGYEESRDKLAWGADYEYTLRTGTNDNDYTLGDKYALEGWVRWTFSSTITGTTNLTFMEVGRISGADPELDPAMSPEMDASNYGGRRLDLGVAVNYETPQMTSVGAEFAMPVYQDLFGPQMKTEWIASLKFGYMF
jgi:hypothetical protein